MACGTGKTLGPHPRWRSDYIATSLSPRRGLTPRPPLPYAWIKDGYPHKSVKRRGQTVQNDDIQEQFNDAVAAGDYRLAERIARIWLLRLQATMLLRKALARVI
jgi:hypothetical protein